MVSHGVGVEGESREGCCAVEAIRRRRPAVSGAPSRAGVLWEEGEQEKEEKQELERVDRNRRVNRECRRERISNAETRESESESESTTAHSLSSERDRDGANDGLGAITS